jgi:hypothetical protein
MSAARRGAAVATVLGLTIALGACGGAGAPPNGTPKPAAPTVSALAEPVASPSGRRLSAPPSVPAQGLVTTSTFVAGDMVAATVTRVQPLLVLLNANGRSGVIRGGAYAKVKVGDRVIVRITEPDGRFEATLVHVSTRS